MYPIEDLVYIPYVSNIRLSRYSMCIQQKSSIQIKSNKGLEIFKTYNFNSVIE